MSESGLPGFKDVQDLMDFVIILLHSELHLMFLHRRFAAIGKLKTRCIMLQIQTLAKYEDISVMLAA